MWVVLGRPNERAEHAKIGQGTASQDFICHGIEIMADNLTKPQGVSVFVASDGETRAVMSLVDCLLRFLRGEREVLANLDLEN